MEISTQNFTRENLNFSHFKSVALVALLLLGISWMKDPEIFSVFRKPAAANLAVAQIPRNYVYVPLVKDPGSLAWDDSAQAQGLKDVNGRDENTSVSNAGKVLGVNTGSAEINLDKIKVQKIADSLEAAKSYLRILPNLENDCAMAIKLLKSTSADGGFAIDVNSADMQTSKVLGESAYKPVQNIRGPVGEIHPRGEYATLTYIR